MREYKTKMSGERRTVNYHSKLVAKDNYYKSLEHEVVRDKSIFDAGMEWFNKGYSLDDASDEMKENNTFVDGYKKGERLASINNQLFDLGKKWYEEGRTLSDAPEKYVSNEHFCSGYESGHSKSSGKQR